MRCHADNLIDCDWHLNGKPSQYFCSVALIHDCGFFLDFYEKNIKSVIETLSIAKKFNKFLGSVAGGIVGGYYYLDTSDAVMSTNYTSFGEKLGQ